MNLPTPKGKASSVCDEKQENNKTNNKRLTNPNKNIPEETKVSGLHFQVLFPLNTIKTHKSFFYYPSIFFNYSPIVSKTKAL
jgi:hypothetical protein